jgi:hypothetical protein
MLNKTGSLTRMKDYLTGALTQTNRSSLVATKVVLSTRIRNAKPTQIDDCDVLARCPSVALHSHKYPYMCKYIPKS